MRLQIGSQ